MNNHKKNFHRLSFGHILWTGVIVSLVVRGLLEFTFTNSHVGSPVALLICMVCLFIYYGIAKQDKTEQHNPDNLYYMGLLFTLASLVYSLITLFIFNTAGDDESARVNNLVGSFGIALISTFLGILLRIMLLQKGAEPPPPEPDGQALIPHQDLAEAAFRLRQELTQTLADMRAFRISFIQANDETVREADKARAAMMQRVNDAADEQVRIFAKLTKNVQQPLEALARTQTERLEQTVSRGEKLESVFNALEESLQSTMRNLQSTAKESHDLTVEYDALNTRLQHSASLFGKVGDEIKQVAETLSTNTEALSESLTEATQVMPQYAEEFVQLIASLRQEATQWQSMTQEVRSSLVQAVADLTEIVKQ